MARFNWRAWSEKVRAVKPKWSNACPVCGGFMEAYHTMVVCLNDDCGFVAEIEKVKQ